MEMAGSGVQEHRGRDSVLATMLWEREDDSPMKEMAKQDLQAALKQLAVDDPEAFMELLGKVVSDDPDLLEAVNRALARLPTRNSRRRRAPKPSN